MSRPRLLALYRTFGAETERVWLECAEGLAARGWDVTCGFEEAAAEAPPSPLARAALRRIRVPAVAAADTGAQMDRLAGDVEDPAMRALLGQGFEALHGHGGTRVLQGAAWLARGVPLVLSLYGYDASRLLREPGWAERYRWAAERGAVFVVLSDAMRERLGRCGLPRSQVAKIPLGLRLAAWPFTPLPAPRSARFVFLGRLTPKKRPEDAVAAFARLAANGPFRDARLTVVGDGPLRDPLRVLAAGLGVARRIDWSGALPRAQVAAVLAGATALLLPSATAGDGDAEGVPMALLEAQALGVPCVTTAHGGNPEALSPAGRRYVVPERDVEHLAAALAEIAGLDTAARRALQRAGRAWVEARFRLEQSIAAYDALLRSLVRL